MKKLQEIIPADLIISNIGSLDVPVSDLAIDSRENVKVGNLFIAVSGDISDGHNFIDQAIEHGATSIVCEHLPGVLNNNVTYVVVADSHLALGLIAESFYDDPSTKINLVGVTGTNGKTTVATLLYELFTELGYKCGLISTAGNKIGNEEFETERTTPDALSLARLLFAMLEAGCKYVFMEVSSHAVVQKRLSGLKFRGGIFTNLTQDHLDYHKTMQAYAEAKQKFFTSLPDTAFALSNLDDPYGKMMLEFSDAKKVFYALEDLDADFQADLERISVEGINFSIDDKNIHSSLIGRFNVYNVLAVYATAILLDQDGSLVQAALINIKPPRGRFEHVNGKEDKKGITGIVDYAHTPDALEKILKAVRQVCPATGKIIVVVGAGGNRDKTKRPIMARIAYDLADSIILTSDNPRFEDPEDIILDMLAGLEGLTDDNLRNKIQKITDRRQAIISAVAQARSGDIILLTGKGHENYQEIEGVKHHFDDKEELLKLLGSEE